jgi:hypothetical protein
MLLTAECLVRVMGEPTKQRVPKENERVTTRGVGWCHMLRKIARFEFFVVRITLLILLTLGAIHVIVGAMSDLLSVLNR